MIGSMLDCPENLLEQIKRLEDIFTVPKETLKTITDHFVSELAKGKSTVIVGGMSVNRA